jgi:hypothetical protein
MRRWALLGAVLAVLLLTLLCGVGSLRVWAGQGRDLVMRGADNVQIERRGALRLNITYQLPANQTRHDLRMFLVRQGWRKAGGSNMDREMVMTFVRPGWRDRMREVLVITTDPSHRIIAMQFGHCFTIGAWATCI